MKKRGLSNVVATVFIILMTIIAALLIWFYVRSSITESSERVQMQEKCYVIETELENCEYGGPLAVTFQGQIVDYYYMTGLVKLTQGDSTEIRVAYYAEDGTSVIKDLRPIDILQTKKILPPTSMTKPPAYAIASPIIYNGDKSKNLVCPISRKVICKKSLGGNLCEIPTSVEDIDLFNMVLTNQPQYDQLYPACNITNANFNCDEYYTNKTTGVWRWEEITNNGDIDSFNNILSTNGWLLCDKKMICEESAAAQEGQNCWTNPDWCDQNCKPPEE